MQQGCIPSLSTAFIMIRLHQLGWYMFLTIFDNDLSHYLNILAPQCLVLPPWNQQQLTTIWEAQHDLKLTQFCLSWPDTIWIQLFVDIVTTATSPASTLLMTSQLMLCIQTGFFSFYWLKVLTCSDPDTCKSWHRSSSANQLIAWCSEVYFLLEPNTWH